MWQCYGIKGYKQVLINKTDIIIKNKTDKICLLKDVAILSDGNVLQKEIEKN